MFDVRYAWNELRRRLSRTVVTALGLALGVGLVMGIIGVSNGLNDAQNKVLSPLSSVGTDIIVSRTVDPAASSSTSTSSTTTTSTAPNTGFGGPPGGGGPGGGGGGGFFGRATSGLSNSTLSTLNSGDEAALLNANSSILTDLAKLGKPGTKFTHDFFYPNSQITFPQAAVGVVSKIPGVTSATPGLSLQATHETGTVPRTVATFKTGGNTLTATAKPPALTAAQQSSFQTCIQSKGGFTGFRYQIGGSGSSGGGGGTTTGGFPPTGGKPPSGSHPQFGHGFQIDSSKFQAAIYSCLPADYKTYETNVVEPEQTIQQVLNPPSTDTTTTTYTVGGVDPLSPNSGLVTAAQVTTGTWFTSNPADEVLVAASYASSKKITVGQTLTLNGAHYKVVGIVNPTLTGDESDIYFDIATLQTMGDSSQRVNEVLVKVADASDVNAVVAKIHNELPGATILDSKTLANSSTGSVQNDHKIANELGIILAIVVLAASFLIAVLLTQSSVAKRVREIGTLRAIGWSKGRVVRQIVAETIGIGLLGGAVGVGVGYVVSAAVASFGPTLSITSSGASVGASNVSLTGAVTASKPVTTLVHLLAPIHPLTIVAAMGFAITGGLIAGVAGGWRAARQAPASAMRDLG